MCSHSSCAVQTSAMASSSSMAPALVVPKLPTTANRPSSPVSSSAARSARACHAATLVGRHEDDVDVHHPRRGMHRGVGLAGRGEPPPAARRVTEAQAGVVASRHERREVGGRPAGDEAATGAIGEPGEAAQPGERLVLGGDRPGAALPQPAEDARRADDEVEHVGGRCRRGGHVCQVQGRVHRPAGVHQHVAEQRQRLVPADALGTDHALQGARPAVRPAGRPTSDPSRSSAVRWRSRSRSGRAGRWPRPSGA